LLERALRVREAILLELGRNDTRSLPPVNGHTGEAGAFISIEEARRRRAEARRRALVEEANADVQRARTGRPLLEGFWKEASPEDQLEQATGEADKG
jgi:hypothetical protein